MSVSTAADRGQASNCSEAGALGMMPGIIVMLQAIEALKLLPGIGESLDGRLLCYDALDGTFRERRLRRGPACPGCGENAARGACEDITQLCASTDRV